MFEDDYNLLDANISSHYYIHISEPQRIPELSQENRSSGSIHDVKHLILKDDSLEQKKQNEVQIRNVDSLLQQNSIELLNSLHPEIKQFLKDNFGQHELESIPVESFNNLLIKQFQTMFNSNEINEIRIKLLHFLKTKMCGNLVNIKKLNDISKSHGLLGLVSDFMMNLELQPVVNKTQREIQDIQYVVKNFAQKLFLSLQKQMQIKLNQQILKITQKYNIALTMLYKIDQKQEVKQCKKYKQQIQILTQKIGELESIIKRKQQQLSSTQINNIKLSEDNSGLIQKINRMTQHIKNIEATRHYSIPHHQISSPTSHNNSFDRSRLQQIVNLCSTPKSQKSQLSLIPQVIRGRSQSSSNLQNFAYPPKSRQQNSEDRRLKTQEDIENPQTPRNGGSPIKINTHIIATKLRPVQPQKKWKV